MEELIVISFHDRRRAAKALALLCQLNDKLAIELDDAVIVHRDRDGNLEYDRDLSSALDKGLIRAGLRGGLLSVLVAAPLTLGAVAIVGVAAWYACILAGLVGVVAGAWDAAEDEVWWKDHLAVPKCLVPEVADRVEPGESALIAWVDAAGLETAASAFRGFGGKVVRTTLPAAKVEAVLKAWHGGKSIQC